MQHTVLAVHLFAHKQFDVHRDMSRCDFPFAGCGALVLSGYFGALTGREIGKHFIEGSGFSISENSEEQSHIAGLTVLGGACGMGIYLVALCLSAEELSVEYSSQNLAEVVVQVPPELSMQANYSSE